MSQLVLNENANLNPETLTPNLDHVATGSRGRGLWRLTEGFRLVLFGVIIALALSVLARTGTYYVIRYFIDDFLSDPAASASLWLIAGIFLLLNVVQGAFAFFGGALAARSSEGIVQRLRNFMLNHIQRLPFSYHDAAHTGDLVQRVTSDIDAIRRFFALEIVASSRIIFLFIINFAAILFLDVRLALLSVIVIPFILAISVFFFRLVSNAYDDYQKQEAELTTTLQENLTGVRVVKAFARQDYEEGKFENANLAKYHKGKKLLLMHATYWPITDILCGIQLVAGFVIGALMAINGAITVGTFVAYTGMVVLIIWPMRNLGRLVVEMSRGLVSFERVATVIRETEEPIDQPGAISTGDLRGDIVFDHVSFHYETFEHAVDNDPSSNGAGDGANTSEVALTAGALPANAENLNGATSAYGASSGNGATSAAPPTLSQNGTDARPAADGRKTIAALQDISFRVNRGQRVALLGGTGAGKTSLVNLLPRFYDYTGGHILLDGKELTHYSRKYLRQHIGIVEQEPFLFSRTVRDNITYGVGRDVPQEEVEAAAKAAAIHDVIMTKLPDGYDTLVGERGTTLSGGQKQRVAIARTLLKDPRILILDDSTSSVDTETEAAIRAALERLMEDRTTFIIAHRIQTVMNADLILVLNKGRIEQAGTHDELVQQDGMYRTIYRAQTRIEDELQKELSDDSAPRI